MRRVSSWDATRLPSLPGSPDNKMLPNIIVTQKRRAMDRTMRRRLAVVTSRVVFRTVVR